MKAKEIRGKDDGEIGFERTQIEQDLFGMRFRSFTEGNTDPAKFRRLRRDLARMNTILRERQLGVRGQTTRG